MTNLEALKTVKDDRVILRLCAVLSNECLYQGDICEDCKQHRGGVCPVEAYTGSCLYNEKLDLYNWLSLPFKGSEYYGGEREEY